MTPEVYAKGRREFRPLDGRGRAAARTRSPVSISTAKSWASISQTGLVAAASCEDYLSGIIKKHEFTRPDKEDDRVRHIEALNSQTGPVFLVYRALRQLDELTAAHTGRKSLTLISPPPTASATLHGRLRDAAAIAGHHQRRLPRMPSLYIADGHHRSAAAARVYQARRGAGESAFF